VEVECLPADIVEFFTIDVTELKVGQSLATRDLKLDAKYTLITQGGVSVATVVEAPEEEVVAATTPVEGAPATGSEPEVIAKGKKEEGEDGEAAPAAGAKGDKKEAGKGDKKEAAKPEKQATGKKEEKK